MRKNVKNKSGRGQKGRGSSKCHIVEEVYPSEIGYLGSNEGIYVEKSSPWRGLSRIFLGCQIMMQINLVSKLQLQSEAEIGR